VTEPRDRQVAAALDTILELGPRRLGDDAMNAVRELHARLDERLDRGEWFTVVAVAGGTGVGKSALVNALVGREVTAEGVRRPTTSVTSAALRRHDASSTALLDWLEIPERHQVGDALPDGFILLDLPDHDSVVETHRRTAARLARRVDVVVWVLDPLKYARADAFDGPLAPLTAHAAVLVMVLNRSDELTGEQLETCLADLRARLDSRGHGDAHVLVTSAATGEGVDELRTLLHGIILRRDAASRRLTADAEIVSARLAAEVDALPDLRTTTEDLLPSVLEATDGHRAIQEAGQRYRSDALRGCRSPLAGVVRAPLSVVRATVAGMGLLRPPDPLTSSGVTASRVEVALVRDLGVSQAVGRSYGAMNRSITAAAATAAPELLDAVATAGLDPGRRHWWSALATLRGVAELSVLLGLVWLIALSAGDWLRLPELTAPELVDGLPWPTALILVGVLVRLALGVISRLGAAIGARRHARAVGHEIRRRLHQVVDARLLAPVRAEVEDHRRLIVAVHALGASTGADGGR
jgi:GTP-binding protein EngB required for normal cell division